MPNGDERPLSEVRTSDLESAAFINARFSLSAEGVKEQVKLQTGEVWAELSRTLTHITDMDLDLVRTGYSHEESSKKVERQEDR